MICQINMLRQKICIFSNITKLTIRGTCKCYRYYRNYYIGFFCYINTYFFFLSLKQGNKHSIILFRLLLRSNGKSFFDIQFFIRYVVFSTHLRIADNKLSDSKWFFVYTDPFYKYIIKKLPPWSIYITKKKCNI
jgi:hypothetical protein